MNERTEDENPVDEIIEIINRGLRPHGIKLFEANESNCDRSPEAIDDVQQKLNRMAEKRKAALGREDLGSGKIILRQVNSESDYLPFTGIPKVHEHKFDATKSHEPKDPKYLEKMISLAREDMRELNARQFGCLLRRYLPFKTENNEEEANTTHFHEF